MRSPETFDAFYASSRERLLHEAYALTGDVAAARTAVRDAFAVAWHHWRKVAVIDDQQAWLRPVAHGRARRRATARLWHRDTSLEPEVRATLDALAKLSGPQRQLLVLTALSPLSMRQIARTVGMVPSAVDEELETAVAEFSERRDVDPRAIRGLLEDLRAPLHDVRWPRAPIVRRAGTARRRTHTAAGALLAAAVMVASGTVVAGGTDARASALGPEKATPRISPAENEPEPETDSGPLSTDRLLADDQVVRYAPALDWSTTATAEQEDSDTILLPCQTDPYADPEATGAVVRTWDGTVRGEGAKAGTRSVVTQVVQRSADEETAIGAYAATRGWFAGCMDDRTQLLTTQRVQRTGQEATQFRLRTWGKPSTNILVGVARTGNLVITTLVESRARPVPDRIGIQSLSAAVNRWCGDPDAAACAGAARGKATDPITVGDPPGFLAHVDLPPLTAIRGTWWGSTPEPLGQSNTAATPCDKTSFREKGITQPLSRTFLLPDMPRLAYLGLSQTSANARKAPRAKEFVATIRNRIRSCAQANLGTDVTPLASRSRGAQELHAWYLEVETGDDQTARFLMAVLRHGNTVSQVGFTPDGPVNMSRPDFLALTDRALQRLSDLPGHQG